MQIRIRNIEGKKIKISHHLLEYFNLSNSTKNFFFLFFLNLCLSRTVVGEMVRAVFVNRVNQEHSKVATTCIVVHAATVKIGTLYKNVQQNKIQSVETACRSE